MLFFPAPYMNPTLRCEECKMSYEDFGLDTHLSDEDGFLYIRQV